GEHGEGGESTAVSVLVRFSNPPAGRNLMYCVILENMKGNTLPRQNAVVPQETVLFARSVRFIFFLILPPPPRSTLFPYTTLFRSADVKDHVRAFNAFHRGVQHFTHAADVFVIDRVPLGFADFLKNDLLGNLRGDPPQPFRGLQDRKSTRLNSSHSQISYAVFCLKK